MEQLYSIMRELVEVEYDQESLLCVLAIIEKAYDEDWQGRRDLVVHHAKNCLQIIQTELHRIIGSIDNYIVQRIKEQ